MIIYYKTVIHGTKVQKNPQFSLIFHSLYIPSKPNTSPTIYQSAFYPLCNANPNTASNLLIINTLTSMQSFSSQSNGHIVPETSDPLAHTEKNHFYIFSVQAISLLNNIVAEQQ